MKNRQLFVFTFIWVCVLLAVCGGYAYSYIVPSYEGNDNSSTNKIQATGDINLVLDASSKVNVSALLPGNSVTKVFTVNNPGSNTVTYSIKLIDLVNTYVVPSEIVYTITCSSSGGSCSNVSSTIFPTESANIVTGISINSGETQTFTLTILFKEMGSNQDYNLNGKLRYKIILNDYERTLTEAIFNKNGGTDGISSNGTPDFVKVSPGVNYAEIVDVSSYTVSLISSDTLRYVSDTYSFIPTMGKYTLIDPILVDYASDYVGYYTLNSNVDNRIAGIMYKINVIENNTVTNADRYSNTFVSYDRSNYADMYVSTDQDGLTYYYRGKVDYNYVLFAGKTWRIMRINGDGSIRMILNDYARDASNYIVQRTYNSNSACNYGSVESYTAGIDCLKYGTGTYANESIKSFVNQWYSDNITGNALNFIKTDAKYCVDYSYETVDDFLTFGSYYRLKNRIPSLTCDSPSGHTNGSAETINLSVGLPTVDEVIMAGHGANRDYYTKNTYLYIGETNWFTMSPALYESISKYTQIYTAGTSSYVAWSVSVSAAYRPVINLINTTMVTGDGTINNPYNVIGD